MSWPVCSLCNQSLTMTMVDAIADDGVFMIERISRLVFWCPGCDKKPPSGVAFRVSGTAFLSPAEMHEAHQRALVSVLSSDNKPKRPWWKFW